MRIRPDVPERYVTRPESIGCRVKGSVTSIPAGRGCGGDDLEKYTVRLSPIMQRSSMLEQRRRMSVGNRFTGKSMNEKNMSLVLDKIHDEASKLLALNPSEEAREIIQRIVALARYKFDVLPPDDNDDRDSSPQ